MNELLQEPDKLRPYLEKTKHIMLIHRLPGRAKVKALERMNSCGNISTIRQLRLPVKSDYRATDRVLLFQELPYSDLSGQC